MKIYCNTDDSAIEDTLKVFKTIEGKDLWVLCEDVDSVAPLGLLVKILEVDYEFFSNGVAIRNLNIPVDILALQDNYSDAPVFTPDDKNSSYEYRDGIYCDADWEKRPLRLSIFFQNYCIHYPEEVYSTEELIDMFGEHWRG